MKYPKVSENFRTIMQERGITAQELADKAKVGKSSISHYVNGSHCPSTLRAQELADILKCNPVFLMGLDDAMEKETARTLHEDEEEMVRLFHNASLELRKAALAVLKAAQQPDEQKDQRSGIDE